MSDENNYEYDYTPSSDTSIPEADPVNVSSEGNSGGTEIPVDAQYFPPEILQALFAAQQGAPEQTFEDPYRTVNNQAKDAVSQLEQQLGQSAGQAPQGGANQISAFLKAMGLGGDSKRDAFYKEVGNYATSVGGSSQVLPDGRVVLTDKSGTMQVLNPPAQTGMEKLAENPLKSLMMLVPALMWGKNSMSEANQYNKAAQQAAAQNQAMTARATGYQDLMREKAAGRGGLDIPLRPWGGLTQVQKKFSSDTRGA